MLVSTAAVEKCSPCFDVVVDLGEAEVILGKPQSRDCAFERSRHIASTRASTRHSRLSPSTEIPIAYTAPSHTLHHALQLRRVTMSAEEDVSQTGYEDGHAGGPGAPTPLTALEGMSGLTKRDIQLFVDGGYYTVEAVAYT